MSKPCTAWERRQTRFLRNRLRLHGAASHLEYRKPWVVPDAFTNQTYYLYALKMSLCATICHVIYNGLKWPGISTAYFTVLFNGLFNNRGNQPEAAFSNHRFNHWWAHSRHRVHGIRLPER